MDTESCSGHGRYSETEKSEKEKEAKKVIVKKAMAIKS